jgi:hypothetical protein
MLNEKIHLSQMLADAAGDPVRLSDMFSLFNLGLVETLRDGLLDPEDAVRFFYHSENCFYVKNNIKNKSANDLMGRGVQLSDLFDALPAAEARREFLRELATMRELCLKIVGEGRSVA